jgi:hypothetical protein
METLDAVLMAVFFTFYFPFVAYAGYAQWKNQRGRLSAGDVELQNRFTT